MDSLHPEMQNYSVTVSDDGSATSEYPPEGSSNIHNHMSDDDLDNCGCTRGSVEGTEDEMVKGHFCNPSALSNNIQSLFGELFQVLISVPDQTMNGRVTL